MDPASVVGLAASISGLVDLGQKIAVGLIKTYSAVRDAPVELNKISDDIYTLCGLFEQMRSLSEESQSTPGGKTFRLKTDPLITAIGNCKATFLEIDAALGIIDREIVISDRIRIPRSVVLRSSWPFQREKLREMTQDLEKTKTTLILGLQINQAFRIIALSQDNSTTPESKEDLLRDIATRKAAIACLYDKQRGFKADDQAAGTRQVVQQNKTTNSEVIAETNLLSTSEGSAERLEQQNADKEPGAGISHLSTSRGSPESTEHHVKIHPLLGTDRSRTRSFKVNDLSSTSKNEEGRSRTRSLKGNESSPTLKKEDVQENVQEEKNIDTLYAWFMGAHPRNDWKTLRHTENVAVLNCSVSRLTVSQPEIRSILDKQSDNGRIPPSKALQELSPIQRNMVTSHAALKKLDVLSVGDWETVSCPTLFGDLELTLLLWVSRDTEALPLRPHSLPPPPPPPQVPGATLPNESSDIQSLTSSSTGRRQGASQYWNRLTWSIFSHRRSTPERKPYKTLRSRVPGMPAQLPKPHATSVSFPRPLLKSKHDDDVQFAFDEDDGRLLYDASAEYPVELGSGEREEELEQMENDQDELLKQLFAEWVDTDEDNNSVVE